MDLHFSSTWEIVSDLFADDAAIVQGERRITYGQMDDEAARFGAALKAAGVEPGAKVSLYLYNSPEYIIAQYGAFKNGCVPINVNYRYLDDELAYLVDNSDSEAVVFHTSLGDRVSAIMGKLDRVKAWISVDDDGTVIEAATPYDEFIDVTPQARHPQNPLDHYMLYTGGTTGMPKGVIYEQHAFIAGLYEQFAAIPWPVPIPTRLDEVAAFVQLIHDTVKLVSVPCCPIMHGTGMWIGVMPALITGGTVVLLEERSFDANELLDTIERESVTRPVIVGDAFARPIVRALEAAETPPDLSSVNMIVSSGAMWSAEMKADMGQHFSNAVMIDALGSTEGGSYGQVQSSKDGGDSTAQFSLIPGTLVVTEDGETVPRGSGGKGLLVSETAARGYYKDPDKTAATFRRIDDGWYVITGDWATQEPDGSITLHGRGSNCINTGGEKVFPEEVEEAVKTHTGIDDCYVIGVDDDRFGKRVVAVASSIEDPDETELREHLRATLAGYKIPKQFVFVDELQRAPNGKADYTWAREVIKAAG